MLANHHHSYGTYFVHTGLFAIAQAGDAANVGRWWMVNPVGSGREVCVMDVALSCQVIDGTVTDTLPMLHLERFSFTGTATGAETTSAVRDSASGDAPVAKILTASTGLTLTNRGVIYAYLPHVTIQLGAGAARTVEIPPPVVFHLPEQWVGNIFLHPGEGLLLRQSGAGTASDPRRYIVNLAWGESGT